MTRRDSAADDPDGSRIGPAKGELRRRFVPRRHPIVLEEQVQRVANIQLRIADIITAFAESIYFVYFHIAAFAVWMVFVESNPLADANADRVPGSDTPVNVRDDWSEPTG